MADIVRDVDAMLRVHPEIDSAKTLMVNFNTFAASSLDFFVYCFMITTNWARFHQIKQDVLLRISDIINRHGAECAFPTSTGYLRESAEPPGVEHSTVRVSSQA